VRRARLHYLRQRQGKEAMSVKDLGQQQTADA
jgi:ribosomal protein L19